MNCPSNTTMEGQYNETRGTEFKQAVNIFHPSCSD